MIADKRQAITVSSLSEFPQILETLGDRGSADLTVEASVEPQLKEESQES